MNLVARLNSSREKNVTLALVLSDNDSGLRSLLANVNVTSGVQYVKDKTRNNSLHLLVIKP